MEIALSKTKVADRRWNLERHCWTVAGQLTSIYRQVSTSGVPKRLFRQFKDKIKLLFTSEVVNEIFEEVNDVARFLFVDIYSYSIILK